VDAETRNSGGDPFYQFFILDDIEVVLNFTWFIGREHARFRFARGFDLGGASRWFYTVGITSGVLILGVNIWNQGNKYGDAPAHR
jgi:hypothetical protein